MKDESTKNLILKEKEKVDESLTECSEGNVRSNRICKPYILLALSGGLIYGTGNIFFGIKCSQYGLLGAGIPAPCAVLTVLIFRIVEACKNKRRVGSFIDYEQSNYWLRK